MEKIEIELTGPARPSRDRIRRRGRRPARRVPKLTAAVLLTVLLPLAGASRLAGEAGRLKAPDPAPPGVPVTMVGEGRTEDPGTDPDPAEPEETGPWNLLLVNKDHPLPEDLEMSLAEVPGGERVDERIYQPLMELLEAAREGNWDQTPQVVSGYRTWEKQQSLYEDKIAKYRREGYSREAAAALAEQWVARPGTSEHQAGLAVDINGATYDVYLWLQENSWRYGFIFRYPGSKTELTGVAEEVWHYRYVGREAAEEIYQRGLCLEEYLAEQEGNA